MPRGNCVAVKIESPFVANGRAMAAGSYTIDITRNGPVILSEPAGTRRRIIMPTMTRLGRHEADSEPELVFDKTGGKFRLSEVWLPGEDGYLLIGTKEQHDHRVVGGPLGKK